VERIRKLFFILGAGLFGLGMILAGLVSIANNRSTAGAVYIISAMVCIALLSFIFTHGTKSGGKR